MKPNVVIDGGCFKTTMPVKLGAILLILIGHWAWQRGILRPMKPWNIAASKTQRM